MAYDKTAGKLLLYGGWDSQNNTFLSDLWLWDGSDWTEINKSMPLMSGHKMVTYSSQILSTFTSGLGTYLWDGESWSSLEISNPPDRPDSALAYDANRKLVVLFGGKRDGSLLNDTWIFNGTAWLELRFPNSPPPRQAHSMFYDEKRKSIILFGGVGESGVLGDTWELNLPQNTSKFIVTQTTKP